MDNAVAVNPNLPLVESASFGGRMAALPMRSKLSARARAAAALVGVVLAMLMWSNKGDYKVLYANLSDKDGGADHRPAVADERALPHARRRRGDPGAGRARCTTCA